MIFVAKAQGSIEIAQSVRRSRTACIELRDSSPHKLMARHKKKRSVEAKPATQALLVDSRLYVLVGLGLILLTTFFAYRPALSGSFLWDDDANVTRPELQPLGGLYRISFEPGATQQYYPLEHMALWLEHRSWGDWARGYHLVSLLWRMLSVVLVYAILNRLKCMACGEFEN